MVVMVVVVVMMVGDGVERTECISRIWVVA